MSKRLINILTLLLVLVLVYLGYSYFVAAPEVEEAPGVTVNTGEGNTSSAEFLDLLLSVKSLSLSKSLFNNVVFRDRLQDFGRELPDRNVGRGNPFAPFGLGGTASSTRLTTSTRATTTASTTSSTPKATTAPKATTTATSTTPGNFNF